MYNSEEAIIREAQKGDNQAVNLLIQRNMDIVYAKARYFFIKGLDREDVIQEGLVGLYKAIRDYREDRSASFRGFAQLCIHRQLVSAIKRANRQKHIPLNSSTSIDRSIDFRSYKEIIPNSDKNLEDKYIYKEQLKILFKVLDETLTNLEKEVFIQYLENKSYQEISKNLQVNIKTVDNALQRARKKIEKIKEKHNMHDLVG
ncbi:MAG TPA: sigma-70 family RNA polymerase sigma factor [Halanaerobiales bacterium]|nr:sigma-70 family RNA polymerase sigma factor [Halanaerobiales bacterium]HPZ63094.1 sigma-70 family RNA polymerase sigma factor [Halanaerobiales bacterium]HQD03979.1 sigma-70 family RNA polymerase sigma factor [Halanaerobiales bacterium]